MIGLDTNVLVRHLAQDDPVQSRQATEIIEYRLNEENPGFVSIVAMVETAWVLGRSYRLSAQQIAASVERMLQIETLVIENEQEVFSAMIAVMERRASFSDAVTAVLGAKAGCTHTLTFDRRASRLPGFQLP